MLSLAVLPDKFSQALSSSLYILNGSSRVLCSQQKSRHHYHCILDRRVFFTELKESLLTAGACLKRRGRESEWISVVAGLMDIVEMPPRLALWAGTQQQALAISFWDLQSSLCAGGARGCAMLLGQWKTSSALDGGCLLTLSACIYQVTVAYFYVQFKV